MPQEVNDLVHTALASPALLAAALLIAPSTVWVIYRMTFGRAARQVASVTGYLWVCQVCHSANPPAEKTCYGCGSAIDRFDSIKLVDSVTGQVIESVPDEATAAPAVRVTKPGALPEVIAVGPGRTAEPVGSTAASSAVAPVAVEADGAATTHVPPERSMSAVGARRPHEIETAPRD